MELNYQANIQVTTDIRELSEILIWFDQFNHPSIPRQIWLQCQLALAEAFTNAVRHAHKLKPIETPIEIEVRRFDSSIELRVWDLGSAFNLNQLLNNLSQTVDLESESGRGLKLMKQIADKIDYSRTLDDRNCLLIIKKYKD